MLSCIGVSRDLLCADYAHSNEVGLTDLMKGVVGAVSESNSVADANFLSAPPEVNRFLSSSPAFL